VLAEREREVPRAFFPTFATASPAADAPPEALRDAATEAEERRREALAVARAEGAREGREAAFREWTERLAAACAALEAADRELVAHREAVAAGVGREAVRLVLLLARKIMRRELALAATGTEAVVEAVAERLAGGGTAVAVRLDPATAKAFETWRRETAAAGRVRVEADPRLTSGDWIIETHDGFLDGRLASQLEEAWRLVEESCA
jgi:flagellar biosynthesis/type III secretory pathway protein FliH